MQNDEIEDTLLMMREALHTIQRGHNVNFGQISEKVEHALALRSQGRRYRKAVLPMMSPIPNDREEP